MGAGWITLTLLLIWVTKSTGNLGYNVEKFEESPGLYYVNKGIVNLYTTTWNTIVYVDLNAEDLEVNTLDSYINHVDRLCNSVEVKNWTGCSQFREATADRFRHLRTSEGLLKEIVGKENREVRQRRGFMNFIGEISKVLFGTLDDNDAEYYDEQIRKFEANSDDTTDLLKQQVYVLKTTLGAFNETLRDIKHNDKLMKKGLSDIQNYLDTLTSETAKKLSIFEAKFMIEKHITQVNNALTILQRNMDLLLDSVVHAQTGGIQPQIVPPQLLLEALRGSQSFFPRDTIPPFPLSKDSASMIYSVCETKVYIKNNKLSYVISTPLVNKGEFRAYYLVPVPIQVNNDRLVYIKTVKSIMCIDNSRQYYYFSSEIELQKCKKPMQDKYVCKQEKPLLSSLVQEECAVRLLKMWKRLPDSCEVSVVQLTHTVWTQVNDNEWVYYTPGTDSMTVLCADQDPVDVFLKGAGRLTLDPTCKGYSKAALLQPVRVIKANSSKSGNNQLVQVELHSECCEELGTRLNLSNLKLDLSFRETVSHADDLKYAGVKIKDLEKHIQEHEWKTKHSVIHHGYSIVLYVVVSLFGLYAAYRVLRCMVVKGLCRGAAGALRLTYPNQANPDFTGSGNVVNINIKSSNESLSSTQEAIPLRDSAPSGSRAGESEAGPSRRLRQTRTRY
jgi:hypothetical protein